MKQFKYLLMHVRMYTLMCIFILLGIDINAQTKRVLFLGNSYTYVNNLPQLTADVAASTGKTIIFDMNAPGGYYLAQHVSDQMSLAKIGIGNWDNVVLQDQSMALAYPSGFMNQIKFSIKLDSIIKANNQCAQTIFYSTWGRKNGDMYLCTPPECATNTWITRTYFQMDSSIGSHYKIFADSIKAGVSPVGAVWRYIRANYPTIELFQPDESHPSLEGSYAAACCFYTAIFRSDPTLVTYNSSLSATDAANIRQAVKQVVYDNLMQWNIGKYDHLLNAGCLPLGIKQENKNSDNWIIFPNPVNDVLTITLNNNGKKSKLYIYNTQGILVKEADVTQTSEISFAELAAGLYMIRKENDERYFKIVKQ